MLAVARSTVDAGASSVPVTFSERFIRRLPEMSETEERDIVAQQRLEVALHFIRVQPGYHQVGCHTPV